MNVTTSAHPLITHQHFALRRLHSLCGIVPIGLFLINHMLANSTAYLGEKYFNHHINLIHDLPWLLPIEILFIFLPLAFHGIYGVVIAWQGKLNQGRYPYADNWRYTLQRITAYITIVFVLVHLLHYRLAPWIGGESYASAHDGVGFFEFTWRGFAHLLPTSVWLVIYAIGLTAAIYHFCNGIVTFCITWGIVVGDDSRKRLSVVTAAFGLLLMLGGVLSLVAFGQSELPDRQDQPHVAVIMDTGGD